MVPWRSTEAGFVTTDILDWYGRFARGRPGALVVEATGIRDVASGPLLRINDDRFIPGLEELVRRVREESGGHTRLLIQIIDFLTVRRRPTPEKFFARFVEVDRALRSRLVEALEDPGWAEAPEPSVRACLGRLEDSILSRVLTARALEDLRMGYRERVWDVHLPWIASLPEVLPDAFARAAKRAEKAGFDGVELHFAHAYTMAGFLSRLNDRPDGYGNSREGRLRLPLETYHETRSRLSSSVALGCRFLADESIDGGSTIDDAVAYAVAFSDAGMDFLSLSKGGKFEDAKPPRIGEAVYPYTGPSGHECMPTVWMPGGPFGRNLPLAATIRAAVRKAGYTTPIVAAGGLNTFAIAERALRDGSADIIASARQSLADPDWFEKARLGRGHEIRRCLATNYCEGLDQKHKQVTCQLWDRVGTDGDGVALAKDTKRRLVAPEWVRRSRE